MNFLAPLTAVAIAVAGSAFAESHEVDLTATGDAAVGESDFKKCISCHVVRDADGETLAGRNGRTGPNLYGIVGATAGSVEDFRYSKILAAAGEQEIVWDEANFVGYVMDPSGWLQEATGESGRSKMSYKVRKEDEAKNLYAYLKSLGPEMEEGEGS